jgi:hypothetical protein
MAALKLRRGLFTAILTLFLTLCLAQEYPRSAEDYPLSPRLRQRFGILAPHDRNSIPSFTKSSNGTLTERTNAILAKRYDDSDFQHSVAQGNSLLCLLEASIDVATMMMNRPSQSTYTDYGALATYGYTVANVDTDQWDLSKYSAMAKQLSISTAAPPNKMIKIMHSVEWDDNKVSRTVSCDPVLISFFVFPFFRMGVENWSTGFCS